jgi:transglycosylase-like protein with SLT domain
MTRRQGLTIASLIALALLSAAAPASAAGEGQKAQIPVIADDQVCLQKIRSEERAHRIPSGLLAAIGFTESGRTVTGRRAVWPWTVNAEGEGHFFESKADGVESIDVGCMQINLKHHPDAFASLDDAFDPATNVGYGADFLKSLHDQTNGWLAAARRYHSATPEKGEPYGELVLANWSGAAKQKELAADTAVAAAEPTSDTIQLTSAAGFLRAQPVRVEPVRVQTAQLEPVRTEAPIGNLSLFSQFYVPQPTAPQPQQTSGKTAGQAAGKTSGSLFASTQRIFQRRVVPGQTGLTLKDYRAN